MKAGDAHDLDQRLTPFQRIDNGREAEPKPRQYLAASQGRWKLSIDQKSQISGQ
jgi:hypothetical protein